MSSTLAQTPLHFWHVDHSGRMVDFAGWSMPVQYTSIVEEHQATRTALGLFDISHMGRLRFDGEKAAAAIDALVTRSVIDLKPGKIRYALVTNEQGGVLDDVLVYHLLDGAGGSYYLMVVNASNREKILGWIKERLDPEVSCTDLTKQWAMIAAQGPQSLRAVQGLVEVDLAAMKYYSGKETAIAGHGGIVSRTGYTGEDGVELMVGAAVAEPIWRAILDAAGPDGARAAGLGARDTLRLEAAMPLYGHELNEDVSPLQAGLGFAVDLDKAPFPGQAALRRVAEDASLPKLIGLETQGRRVPREGYAIECNGERVGEVTSGTFSPTLQKPIAMGYVAPRHAAVGTPLEIDIRGRSEPATIVPLPFYKRSR